MIEKKITLNISGNDYVLNFGVNWFYEFYKQDSGHDLIADPAFEIMDIRSSDVFKITQSLIWAGMKSECALNNRECPLQRSAVADFIMCTDITSVTEILWNVITCISGEVKDDVKQESIEKKNEPVGMS